MGKVSLSAVPRGIQKVKGNSVDKKSSPKYDCIKSNSLIFNIYLFYHV